MVGQYMRVPPAVYGRLSSGRSPARTGRRAWSAPAGIAAPRWPRAGTPSAGAPRPSAESTSGHRGPRCRSGACPRGRSQDARRPPPAVPAARWPHGETPYVSRAPAPRERPRPSRPDAWTLSPAPPQSAPVVHRPGVMRLRCHAANLRAVNRLSKQGEASHPLACRRRNACGAVCKGRLDRRPSRGHTLAYPPSTRHSGQTLRNKGDVQARRRNQMAKTMRSTEQTEVSEAQIAVHWKEEAYYQPSEQFKAEAIMQAPNIFDRFALDKFPDCFKEYADMLTWFEPYRTVLDTSDAPFWKWFAGGKINASYNCVDRHLTKYGSKAAFIFVPEPEAERDVVITYRELHDRVNEAAAMLRGLGLKAADQATFHLT